MQSVRRETHEDGFLSADPVTARIIESFDSVRSITGATSVFEASYRSGYLHVGLCRTCPDLIIPGDSLELPPEFSPEFVQNTSQLIISSNKHDPGTLHVGTNVIAKQWRGHKTAQISNGSFSFGPIRALVTSKFESNRYVVLCSLHPLKIALTGAAGMMAVLAKFAAASTSISQELDMLRGRIDRAEIMATADPLTSLANRAGFSTALEQEQRRALRYMGSTTVAIIDLDGLKIINDTKGHSEGDQVIVHAAQIIKDTCRSTDTVARLGGDEFAILAPETDQAGAEMLLARLRHGLARASISASIGIANTNGPNPDIPGLIEKADQLMYREKNIKKRSYRAG
jgi:diguanylate cyclase (GGDEF)-like protein